jgi:hypothetical protein
MRSIPLGIAGNRRNFRKSRLQTGLEKVSRFPPRRALLPFSLEGKSAVRFRESTKRTQCDHKPMLRRKRVDLLALGNRVRRFP